MQITQAKHNGRTDITLKNGAGLTLTVSTLGAGIRDIYVPDRDGKSRNVTMYPQDEELFAKAYYGKTIGRTAGRIEGATFTINGKTAHLDRNNAGRDNLHGGAQGLHGKIFDVRTEQTAEYTDAVFTYFSPDGEGGYFGNVHFTVVYRVRENVNTFSIRYDATTDEPTLVNLTNHVYLNLSGESCEHVTEHEAYIAASRMGKLNDRLIVDDIVPVTAVTDFRTPHKIGDHMYAKEVQSPTGGYDHVYFLDAPGLERDSCSLYAPHSGIRLTMRTTAPCVVFYTNSAPKKGVTMQTGKEDEKYLAACLECEGFSGGLQSFPQYMPVTTPQKPYHEETVYMFDVK